MTDNAPNPNIVNFPLDDPDPGTPGYIEDKVTFGRVRRWRCTCRAFRETTGSCKHIQAAMFAPPDEPSKGE